MSWWQSFKKHFRPVPVLKSFDPDGFRYSLGRQTKRVDWREIAGIDVGRSPTLVVETFYVVMHLDRGETIILDDRDKLFEPFSGAVFLQWPEIRNSWVRVFTGPPDVPEHATLWTSRKAY